MYRWSRCLTGILCRRKRGWSVPKQNQSSKAYEGGTKVITTNNSHEEIQAAIDAGGVVEFAPGIYEHTHYRISKPVHLIGNGAVLIGGKKIQWQRVDNSYLLCCNAPGEQPLRSLVVNGELRKRCRLPENGYWNHESVFPVRWMGTSLGGWERKPTEEELMTLRVAEGALDGITLDSAEITVVHSWSDSLVRIEKVEGQIVTFDIPVEFPAGGFGVKSYCLWNVPEALKMPGTFYHDTKAGKLYYYPLPGEDEHTVAYLPKYENIFYAEEPISDVEIEGFTLMCTEPSHVVVRFGAHKLSGAIELGEAANVKLHDLDITAVGGHGIRAIGKVTNMQVTYCHIHDIGAGALRTNVRNEEVKSEITDCHIHHVGLYYPSAIGISAFDFNTRHNEIHDTSYSALCINGNDFVIEKNHVYNTMLILNDGAASHSGNTHRVTLRNNLVYGIQPKDGHRLRIAYYLDELTRDWVVEHNVALECNFPNHNHMCGDHLYKENIFVNSKGSMFFDMLNTKWTCHYVGNVFSAGGDITVRMAEDAMTFEHNYFHSADGVIRHSITKNGEMIGEKILEMSDSNQQVEGVSFEKDERVFTVGDLTIDLRDVGPRHR